MLQEILRSGVTDDMLCDIGMPVIHRGEGLNNLQHSTSTRHNCAVL